MHFFTEILWKVSIILEKTTGVYILQNIKARGNGWEKYENGSKTKRGKKDKKVKGEIKTGRMIIFDTYFCVIEYYLNIKLSQIIAYLLN